MSDKPIILVGRKLTGEVEARLKRDYAPRLNAEDRCYSSDELIELCEGAEAILPCHTEHLSEEVIERRARMQRAIGPMVGRMERELLRPLVDRTWMMMFRAGEFGPPPPQLRQADEIEVVFEGPLARAQRLDVVESGLNTLRALGNVGQVYPEIRDHFDADEWARDAATALGSGKYLRDPEAIETTRQQRAQQQQAAAQLQGGLQVAETAVKVAGAAARAPRALLAS